MHSVQISSYMYPKGMQTTTQYLPLYAFSQGLLYFSFLSRNEII